MRNFIQDGLVMNAPFLQGEEAIPFPTPGLVGPEDAEIERELGGAGALGRADVLGAGGFEAFSRCNVFMGNLVLRTSN